MIVYLKNSSGELYASPVFAEFGTSWEIKSVILDETSENLILMPVANGSKFNFFYIDESIKEGWIEKGDQRGFKEIFDNKELLNKLKKGEKVSVKGLECVKLYNLPLKPICDFEVLNQEDIETFSIVCWGLHDANIVSIERNERNIIIKFDTTWGKTIIITFIDVIEERDLDKLACILDSTFVINEDNVEWKVIGGFDTDWEGLNEDQVGVKAKKILWKLIID